MAQLNKATQTLNWLRSRQAGVIGLIAMVIAQAFHASLVLTKISFFWDNILWSNIMGIVEGLGLSVAISFSIIFYTLRNNRKTALAFTILEVAINLAFYAYKLNFPINLAVDNTIIIMVGIIISFVIPFSTYNFAKELKIS